MRMTGIVVNGPSNDALMNCVHLWTLKFVDNTPYSFKESYKVLLEMRHGNRTEISNTNRNSVGVKIGVTMLATVFDYNSHASNVQ